MKKIHNLFLINGVLFSSLAIAQNPLNTPNKPLEITVGIEHHQETYREYKDNERFMQQKGRLNGFNASAKYHFNQNHSLKLEGRYAKGKIDYTGGINPDEENTEGTPYGSVTQKNAPRRTYDVRALYGYQQAITHKIAFIGEAGFGYRVLKDLSSRIDLEDYDRKNKTAYAQIGVGLKMNLPYDFEFAPKIAYNHGIYARQYTYLEDSIKLKQRNVRGMEIELPISKKFANQSKLSFTPFYRGWRAPDSTTLNKIETDENGIIGIGSYTEPKNYTHETGVKLQYTF